MKCYHTGLPQSMCGHCNGTHPLERDEFRPRGGADETPRLVKMRGKVEWRGIGLRTFGQEHATNSVLETRDIRQELERVVARPDAVIMNPMGLAKGSCIRPVGFSAWSREQSARTLANLFRGKRQ